MSEKTYMDFPRITHDGKYGVLYDYAVTTDGALYYASFVGSRQMCEGIAAAMLDSGRRNSNAIHIISPTDGSNGVFNTSRMVHIAHDTIGAMRRITRNVQGTRVSEVTLISQLVKWNYNYAHLQSKNALEEKEESDFEKAQKDLAMRRFVLLADEDEDEAYTARRWFAYLPKRVSEPMLAEWALPLWDYCTETAEAGVSELKRLRGKGWLCEPSKTALRGAITELGKRGALPLPDNLREYIEQRKSRDYYPYDNVAVAAA